MKSTEWSTNESTTDAEVNVTKLDKLTGWKLIASDVAIYAVSWLLALLLVFGALDLVRRIP